MTADPSTVERALIGAMLVAPDVAVPWVLGDAGVGPDDFAGPARRRVFEAIVELDGRGGVDSALLADRLAGDLDALAELQQRDVMFANAGKLKQYARSVRGHAQTRRVVDAAQRLIEAARNGTSGKELADLAVSSMDDAALGAAQRTSAVMADRVIDDAITEVDRAARSGEEPGMSTGFSGFDKLTGGLRPGNLVIVAARPAMGKSALVVNIAEHQAMNDRATALFTLEMSGEEVGQRLIASRARVSLGRLRSAQLRQSDYARMVEAGQSWSGKPLLIDDTADLSVSELRARARQLHRRHRLRFIVVDYLQLLRGRERASNRTQAVDEISRGLKVLAKELGVVVIAVAQLSRQVESRGATVDSKRPMLADLRESGAIEQDADVVCFVFRRDYYELQAGDEPTDPGGAELIVAKNRSGGTGDVPLVYLGEYVQFRDREEDRHGR